MATERSQSPKVRRLLADLPRRPPNFDPKVLEAFPREPGWQITDVRQQLPSERPGDPIDGGSWQIARQLMRGYEFADPSIVRAFYDPDVELKHRNMVLELRAFGVFRLYVGVRVSAVYDRLQEVDGRQVRVWGWSYRTLQGHIEMGQMAWEVWKWLDSGEVEFRVHAISKYAKVANPIIGFGVRIFRSHERKVFLDSTKTRMRTFVELALQERTGSRARVRAAAAKLTARPMSARDPTHGDVARSVDSEERD